MGIWWAVDENYLRFKQVCCCSCVEVIHEDEDILLNTVSAFVSGTWMKAEFMEYEPFNQFNSHLFSTSTSSKITNSSLLSGLL